MDEKEKDPNYKKFLKGIIGIFVLVLGVTLILVWWNDVLSLFRGGLGMILAIGGLVTLYMLNK